MNKYSIVIIFVLVIASIAHGDPTPFQRMEALFTQATPMTLGQFLTPNDPEIKNWNCVGASRETKESDLQRMGTVPARVQGKVVTPAVAGYGPIAPTPAKPSPNGPLFPGTPATPGYPAFPGTPEKVEVVDAIAMVPNDGSYNVSAEKMGQTIRTQRLNLSTSPEFVQSYYDMHVAFGKVKATYRTSNGLIVIHQENEMRQSFNIKFFPYVYCYKL